jgi:hypothetical protein
MGEPHAEKPHHVAAYEFYRDLPKRGFRLVARRFSVSTTSIRNWSNTFNWNDRIAKWDTAVIAGLEDRGLDAAIDTSIYEIERLNKGHAVITTSLHTINIILEQCIQKDETGKEQSSIPVETIQDLAALLAIKVRLILAEAKLIETRLKVQGIPDRHEIITTSQYPLTDDPDIMDAENALLKLIAEKENDG